MRIAAFVILTFTCFSVYAQQTSTAELEKRRQAILESVKQAEEQLNATKKDKNATMGQLHALQAKLAERQKLINNINEEIGQINNNIESSGQEITRLRGNLAIQKMRYAQSVRYAYQSRSSYDMLAFLFSSRDYNEALRRMRYLRKIRDYRKQQADQIRVTQGVIVKKIDVLNTVKAKKDDLLSDEEKQKAQIQNETNETNSVISQLKGREKELALQIEKDKKTAKQLNKAINDIIVREMEIQRKKAEEEARKRAEEERRRQEEARRAALAAQAQKPTVAPGSRQQEGPIYNNTNRPAVNTQPVKPNTTINNNPNTAASTYTPPPRAAVVPKNYDYSLTPEANALSASFESNRGRLPWPVEKGNISGRFGVHKHAIAEKVNVENNGIDISTSNGASARAVFDGTVTKVFSVDGRDWNVIVTHGNYFTVYTHLSKTTVQTGQQVRTKQPIGTVAMNDEGETIINFQIWKGGSKLIKLDPEGWVAR
ncbi:MAG: peptidoglycan DD-metalloendopeptidase family protein [Bacteroidetes bacterium]|nr:peptidoglycan DD-metalloendopeptidase family protein [Bacteroidota bacterium]